MISIVILAIFDELITDRTDSDSTRPIMSTELFYKKLVRMSVKRNERGVATLTAFLAYKSQDGKIDLEAIDVRRLATVTGEFMKSEALRSYGVTKRET